jgi:FAD/FMN-containing dehydrogenase
MQALVTGNCLCTGITGIMLGGGHGYLQGLYGLLADQILEAHVVMADGSSVIASPKSNPNLFWALRGAGHNFGIVTRLKYRIYDRVPEWSQYTLIFTQDKLEQVFELSNNFLEENGQPAQLINWYTLMLRPDIDPESVSLTPLHNARCAIISANPTLGRY